MGAEDGAVARQVVEAVHDDGDDDVQHDERAEKDEGNEVEVGHVRPASLVRLDPMTRCLVELVGPLVAFAPCNTGHHDVWPSFTGGTPVETQIKKTFKTLV